MGAFVVQESGVDAHPGMKLVEANVVDMNRTIMTACFLSVASTTDVGFFSACS